MKPVNSEFIPHEGLETDQMKARQRKIKNKADFTSKLSFHEDNIVAGVDQAFLDDKVLSGAVVFKNGRVIEKKYTVEKTPLPYIPGLLSFREGRSIVKTLEKLEHEPDLLMLDGSGRIHFREAGIATHIGVVFDSPALGIAKNLLCGSAVSDTSKLEEGEKVAVVSDKKVETCKEEETIGYAVQTRNYPNSHRINPVYISPGHRMNEEKAAELALQFTEGYKLPEPTRKADKYIDSVKKKIDTSQQTL